MSNTLISMGMVLAKAMWLVAETTPEPCEITADFCFTTSDLILQIDDFTSKHLRPAIDLALERKRQLVNHDEFESRTPGLDMEECAKRWGIAARIGRWYDINTDTMLTRIDMRVGIDSKCIVKNTSESLG